MIRKIKNKKFNQNINDIRFNSLSLYKDFKISRLFSIPPSGKCSLMHDPKHPLFS